MPRNLSALSIATIAQRTGLEPINIVKVQWVRNGPYFLYSDRQIDDVIHGKLISLDNLEAVLNIQQSGTTTSLKIVLDDTDNLIKNIFDNHDVHARSVSIYQWFSDIPLNDMFLLFEGRISSPMTWNEGDRTFSFDVVTQLEDRDVGFSVEDGDFLNVPEILLGRSWPLVFGTVSNMPTLQMDEIPTGTTRIPIGIPDPNLFRQANYLDDKAADQAARAACLSLKGAELQFLGQTADPPDRELYERGSQMQAQARQLRDAVNKKMIPSSKRFKNIFSDQQQYDVDVIPIINGNLFKQNRQIEIDINGASYVGSFQGENFLVVSRRAPKEPVHREPKGDALPGANRYGIVIEDTQEETDAQIADMIFGRGIPGIDKPDTAQSLWRDHGIIDPKAKIQVQFSHDLPVANIRAGETYAMTHAQMQNILNENVRSPVLNLTDDDRQRMIANINAGNTVGGNLFEGLSVAQMNQILDQQVPLNERRQSFTASFVTPLDEGFADAKVKDWSCDSVRSGADVPAADKVDSHKEGEFFFANAGSSVTVKSNYPIRYILSITPGTKVLHLSAKRFVNHVKKLAPIPPNLYRIETRNFGSVEALVAIFNQPLSTLEKEDWEDDVYATLQSSIGPNPVDIMIWLIQTYTEHTVDTVSFNYVRAKLQKYPAHFALLDKKNVVDLLKDISWQSRCAIWLTNGKFYLKYLPEQGTVIDDLSRDDIEANSLEISSTPSEDIVTKFVAEWRKDYSKTEKNKLILKYNINKYGTREQSFDFYIFNRRQLVLKSATFWLIRMSNMWKKLLCKTALTKLKLETMDDVAVAQNLYVANTVVNGLIEKATFNSADFHIQMDIWLPVRLGEMHQYNFAYPANIPSTDVFPTDEDIAGGFSGDTPFDDAEGDLEGNEQFNTPKKQSQKKSRTNPSDSADTSEDGFPPIMTTTEPYTGGGPINSGVRSGGRGTLQAGINNQIVRTAPVQSIPEPKYDYRFDKVEQIQNNTSVPLTATVAIGVIGKKDDDGKYGGFMFPLGTSNAPVAVKNVIIPQLNPDETIPPNTYGIFIRYALAELEKPRVEFYFQPPVWLSEITE